MIAQLLFLGATRKSLVQSTFFKFQCSRLLSTLRDIVEEGDQVLLRPNKNRYSTADTLTQPLKLDGKTKTPFRIIKHADIIGKTIRDSIPMKGGLSLRIHNPTLSEYVNLSPRKVTPLYSWSADRIVSLLDLHVPQNAVVGNQGGKHIEILEAGTGHGSLTLHLARAVHATNSQVSSKNSKETTITAEQETERTTQEDARNAVIHTIDIDADISRHAQNIVAGFRGGIYLKNVDFHTGKVTNFIDVQLRARGVPGSIFSHIVLDLPDVDRELPKFAQALRSDGYLVVFCPNTSQIINCVATIKRQRLPLAFEQVVELEGGMAHKPGRQWDVRALKHPYQQPPSDDEPTTIHRSSGSFFERLRTRLAELIEPNRSQKVEREREEELAFVCRPLVGHRISGGGFVGVWRKMKTSDGKGDEDEE